MLTDDILPSKVPFKICYYFAQLKDVRVLNKETVEGYKFKKSISLDLLTKLHHKYFSSLIIIYYIAFRDL